MTEETQIRMIYDEASRQATFTFANGKTLKLGNVTEEQAIRFRNKNGAEFERRDACFTTDGGHFTRGVSRNGR